MYLLNLRSEYEKMLAILVLITLSAMPSANAASVKGSQGQILSVSKTTAKSGAILTVSGQYFDETVGIYLAFCVVPKGRTTNTLWWWSQ